MTTYPYVIDSKTIFPKTFMFPGPGTPCLFGECFADAQTYAVCEAFIPFMHQI